MSKIAWPAWIVLTLVLTAKPFAWHLEYFRRPGPQFLPVYVAVLIQLCLAGFLYVHGRQTRPTWIAREPRVFLLFFLAFFLFYAPLATFYGLWVGFVCFGLGRLALGHLTASALEQATLWPAAGLGFLSALLFVLGVLHLYYRWLAAALLALAAVAFWRNGRRLLELFRRLAAAYAASAANPLWGVCLVAVSAVGILSAMVVLSPEIAFDPISFHFVLAREYAARHQLSVVPRLPYSFFPQNVEILYALGFLLDGQIAAKVITWAFFPLAALSVLLIGARWFSAAGGLIGAALFVTTPFIAWTGSVAKNDLALALYLLLAVYGVIRWSETKRFGWLAAGTMFLGFAFGVKHVAVLGAAPLALLVVCNLRRSPVTLRQGPVLAAIFVCCGLYWHARTFALTGNPLYPEMGASAIRSTTASGHPELSRLERLGVYLSFPWRIHFRGLHTFESPSPNPVGFALLAFFPWLWLRGGIRSRPARLLLVLCLAYFLYWAAILIKVRYAIAAFGVLFAWLGDRMWASQRASVAAAAAYCFAFALTVSLILEINVPRLKLFARRISAEEFLRESLITYRSIEALNRHAHPGERAYSVGNCSTFYSNIEFHCYYDHEGKYSLEEIARTLRETPYQYLLVFRGWAEPRHMHVVQHLYRPALLYEDESFQLYRLTWH